MSIKLGDRVKEKVTGFSGIVTGISDFLTGCKRAGVQPEKLKDDGSVPDPSWFDIDHLTVVKAGVHKPINQETGGPALRNTPMRSANPR